MRVLLVPLGSASHYYPMVPLAWALRTAGHDVRVAAQKPAIRPILESGMPAYQIGDAVDLHVMLLQADQAITAATGRSQAEFADFGSIPAEALTEYLRIRAEAHVRTAEAMCEDLVPFARAWRPDLVVTDPATPAGSLVAKAVGARLVVHTWGTRVHTTNVRPIGDFRSSLQESMARLHDRYGVDPAAPTESLTIVPCPPSLQGARFEEPIVTRHVPYNGSGVEPAWLHAVPTRPRVLISGSIFLSAGTAGWEASHYAALARSLATLDVEVVLATGADVRLGSALASDNIRPVTLLPLRSVLPSCSVAVSHGGSGTLLAAAAFGVPQVLLPRQQEQMQNAASVAAAGAGTWFRADRFDVEEATEAVKSMIVEDGWRAAAQRLKQENDELPPPSAIVPRIERFAGAR